MDMPDPLQGRQPVRYVHGRLIKFLGAAILGGAFLASLSPGTAGAAPTVITSGDFRIEFTKPYQAKYAQFDTIVEQWMQANSIHAAQLAFRKNGKLLFSHAYTMGADS